LRNSSSKHEVTEVEEDFNWKHKRLVHNKCYQLLLGDSNVDLIADNHRTWYNAITG
jgi:hypothetical protein